MRFGERRQAKRVFLFEAFHMELGLGAEKSVKDTASCFHNNTIDS